MSEDNILDFFKKIFLFTKETMDVNGACAMTYPIVNQDNYNHYPADYASLKTYNSRMDRYIYGPPIPVTSTANVAIISPQWGGVSVSNPNFVGASASSYATMQNAYGQFNGCGANFNSSLWSGLDASFSQSRC